MSMKTEKIYRNKDWLEEKYLGKKLSTIQIGKFYNYNPETIRKWLKKHNIKIRSYSEANFFKSERKHKDYLNKMWLENKYIKEKFSIRQIAKEINVSSSVVNRWLHKFNILVRFRSETQTNYCNLSQKAIEWINGEIMGDACLWSCNSRSARFLYSSKYLEYVQYISDTLKSFGIEQVGKIRRYHHKKRDYYTWHYISRSYVDLLAIRRQWYPNGEKIIPKDLNLTPLTCRQWYIGDGSLNHSNSGKSRIILCTCGFPIKYVEWLVKQLIKLGFIATRQPSANVIAISTYSTKQFLDYIGKCPVQCYQYKWEY